MSNSQDQGAITRLKKLFPIGTTVTTVLTSVSRSGMTRTIKVLAYDKECQEIRDVSYAVARVLDYKISDNHGGVIVKGIGMDMGFHLTYSLGHALYKGSRSKKLHNGDPGYALKHTWA